MATLFVRIYDFFKRRLVLFWLLFATTFLLIGFGASRIKLEEDITRFFPDDERIEKLNYVFKNSKFVERIVIMVSVKDSTTMPMPDSMVAFADSLSSRIQRDLAPYINRMATRVDEQAVLTLSSLVYENLPIFLDENDYIRLDSMVQPENARRILENNYRQLISPAGIVVKQIIAKDPLGFSFLALNKLRQLQYDENFELYDGYILTKDHRHLIFFVSPRYSPNDTGHNTVLIDNLNAILNEMGRDKPSIHASYFGAPVVAVGNAQQLRRDTILTVSLVVVFLTVFLIAFFRKKRVPFLIFIPVVFGAIFSLCCIYLLQESISVLAIAAGSVILGIAVNYSLHFLSHLKHEPNMRRVIADLVRPMTIGSATTVVAFFCLHFANAAVLRDLGLFAGFSLIGAALCSLIFLPHLLPESMHGPDASKSWLEKISAFQFVSNRYVALLILLTTPVFLYFAGDVSFNSDMSKLNFMDEDTRTSQARLEAINQSSLSSLYVVASGKDVETALRKSEQVMPVLRRLDDEGTINKFSSVSTFLVSDSLQKVRIQQWEKFWEPRKESLFTLVRQAGRDLKFSERVINNFENLISKEYVAGDTAARSQIRSAFFDDYIIEESDEATVISLVNLGADKKSEVYARMDKSAIQVFDRQVLTNVFVEYVNADFNFIVAFTAIFVFLALLVLYGRIELTIITFAPMMITWIWILGIMALVGIEFNIINVMVSTFIFGLGDDYSIFTMDGLLQEYKSGKKSLLSIRSSIFLSAVTTIAGLGVLILAEHPALKSIAAISIIGIACVFIMSQTIEPFLFGWLVTNRTRRRLPPMTFYGIWRTSFTYSLFVLGSLLLTIIGLALKPIGIFKRQIKLFFHRMLSALARLIIYVEPSVKKKIMGKDPEVFSRPAVIIANHSSLLDILLTTMLHPKMILFTNKWVWNSPVFGSVVRLADYYPVGEGIDEDLSKVKERFKEGYSLVIFPEGTRSSDGVVHRFHKGAFYIAEKFGMPIRPLMIHGAADAIPKGSYYLNAGQLTLKFLPPIEPHNEEFGNGYSERTKRVSKYFRHEFAQLQKAVETPRYFFPKLISNYIYKGPVLEWYTRVKLRLEKYYAPFDALLPQRGEILDLGCGYGFLCYMLHLLSPERIITGVDYDEDKIDVASNGYLKSDRVTFHTADITTYTMQQYDGIVISDVLHYLPSEAQQSVIARAIEALKPNGVLLIREGNADLQQRHRGTVLSEFFSVKVLKFNKSTTALNFLSGESIKRIAQSKGLTVEVYDDAKYTSNVIFVMQKIGIPGSTHSET